MRFASSNTLSLQLTERIANINGSFIIDRIGKFLGQYPPIDKNAYAADDGNLNQTKRLKPDINSMPIHCCLE
jgi:hypothetical protein